MSNDLYRWLFNAEDEHGEFHALTETEWIGTRSDAEREGGRLCDAWERETSGQVLRLELERRGVAPAPALPIWRRIASDVVHIVAEHPDQAARWHWTCGQYTHFASCIRHETCICCGAPLVYPVAVTAEQEGLI